ncbi:hypothetical protein B5M50_00985 [candidate division KSB1 bacterium 4484_219]|nr:MAG: hypothetical protein B5M50_00985 [candidate division KSB1 bacterium 4484_219]
MLLADRIRRINDSRTVAVAQTVLRLQHRGVDILSLATGEPDFPTPSHIKDAAVQAIAADRTKYTEVTGIPELREAIVSKLARDNDLHCSVEEVTVTCGGKHAIMCAILALCQKGDEVIIPVPYWMSYEQQVRLADAVPVFIDTVPENNFMLQPEQLREKITPQTKLLILNNPCNPTGTVYDYVTLAAIADIVKKTGIYVLVDEVYEKIVFDGKSHISLASFSEIRDQVITVNGVSKTYSMTGWRIGFVAACKEIIAAIAKIQSHSTSNPTTVAQWAAVAALTESQECVNRMVEAFEQRRNAMFSRLTKIPGVQCEKPAGTFYVFPRMDFFYGSNYNDWVIEDSTSLCQFLLEEEQVALVPGSAFGTDAHVRFSFATSMETIHKALDRIERGLTKLQSTMG